MKKIMYFGLIFVVFALADGQNCYHETDHACTARLGDTMKLPNCSAKYGNFKKTLQEDLEGYAMANLKSSYNYLLLSTHFGNYETNREGFKSLYRKYSDQLWSDSVDLMKYITKRGGVMNFNQPSHLDKSLPEGKLVEAYSLNEMKSLSKALDEQKKLANKAHEIYNKITTHPNPDPAVLHYLEDKFLEPHADRVRTLAGYSNDLKKMLTDQQASLALFLYDEYLQKV